MFFVCVSYLCDDDDEMMRYIAIYIYTYVVAACIFGERREKK